MNSILSTANQYCARIWRLLLECIPQEWCQAYRDVKTWYAGRREANRFNKMTLVDEYAVHRITVLASCSLVCAATGLRDFIGGAWGLGPLFVLACAAPTLIISRQWGTFVAVFCALAASLTRMPVQFDAISEFIFLWNLLMRFLFFEFFVLVSDFVRVGMGKPSDTSSSE